MSDFGLIAGLSGGVLFVFIILMFWSIAWKGFALWISAREGKKWWFIILLILNTFGILEIIYIFGFSKTGKKCWTDFKNRKSKTSESKNSEITEEASTDTQKPNAR